MAKILIVDDSLTARGILKRMLSERHELHEAGSGRNALDIVAKENFDLVLLDLLMPEMDGFAVLKELKIIKPELPVLVVSADIQETTRKRIIAAGAAGMVNKPLRLEALLEAIDAAAGERK